MLFVIVSFLISLVLCQEDVVTTQYGAVRGLLFPAFRQFQGVPYATPPLGKLRYKNPIPPGRWDTILDCRNFTIGCAQSGHSLDIPKNTSEDCLYLEIFTPRVGKYQQPAVVMVFFYGGDFKEGGESFQIYNGSSIAGTTNTILVVTNYRVGNLGFLYSGTSGVDPNVGLADQRWTLKWVQQNIAVFGGDPTKITIFGQSAGGESVQIHMASPNASAGLFQAVISESGPMSLNFKDTTAAELLAEVFAYEVGCYLSDLDCLINKTTKEILTAADAAIIIPLDMSSAVMKWAPVVTGDANFPQQPLNAFEKGQIIKVPLMAGANLDDGILFGWAISPTPLPAYEYIAILVGIFQDDWVSDILTYYPDVSGDNRPIFSELITDYLFYCSARKTLSLAEVAGIRDTYLYMFTQQPTFCPWPPSQNFCCDAVCHGDEMAYVFHDTGYPYPWNMTTDDLYLSSAMTSYWTSFAHFANPNMDNKYTVWSPYKTATDIIMNLKVPLTPTPNYNKKNCDFWDQVGYYHSTKLRNFLIHTS